MAVPAAQRGALTRPFLLRKHVHAQMAFVDGVPGLLQLRWPQHPRLCCCAGLWHHRELEDTANTMVVDSHDMAPVFAVRLVSFSEVGSSARSYPPEVSALLLPLGQPYPLRRSRSAFLV